MLVNLSKRRDYRSVMSIHKKDLRKWWHYKAKELRERHLSFNNFFKPTGYVGVYETYGICDEHTINTWCKQHATYDDILRKSRQLMQQGVPFEDIHRMEHNAWDYGVADNIEQIIDYYNNNTGFKGNHVIFVNKIRKYYNGGWRWHKWGQYIGTQNPQCEYLDDEPEINEVLIYSIYQVV